MSKTKVISVQAERKLETNVTKRGYEDSKTTIANGLRKQKPIPSGVDLHSHRVESKKRTDIETMAINTICENIVFLSS